MCRKLLNFVEKLIDIHPPLEWEEKDLIIGENAEIIALQSFLYYLSIYKEDLSQYSNDEVNSAKMKR